jgi:hypothetical protein
MYGDYSRDPSASMGDAVFKRLFRQTAAALHPDKESDLARQTEKHELMSRLLQARKERDLITLLRLHEAHAEADSNLSGADEEQLEGILLDYLDHLRIRSGEIVHKTGMHVMVFNQFYDRKPAVVKRRINRHLKKTNDKRRSIQEFVDEVRTLKRLKELLTQRFDAFRTAGY